MYYYEVLLAEGRYHSDAPLTYVSEAALKPMNIVTVPLRGRSVTGFVVGSVAKPSFATKPIKSLLSAQPLPNHCLVLARWLQDYYCCSLGEALRQFAPAKPTIRKSTKLGSGSKIVTPLEVKSPLTTEQQKAIKAIRANPSTTVLLHGETGSGKTRVYLELARRTLDKGQSVILLTPEISLTSQLIATVKSTLKAPTHLLHSQQTIAERKRLWLQILEAKEPVIVVGPRSALFAPLKNVGLIVLDEAHEPAYKQEQSPRYHATRLASQFGAITGAKVIFGTATPLITDYYMAKNKNAIVRMSQPAIGSAASKVKCQVVDIKNRANFGRSPYLSNQLIDGVRAVLADKKQAMVYLNRRGSARLILCTNCGWQLLCPNCDIPLVYHADEHLARCHTCGFNQVPPASCPACQHSDVVYKSIGTKALADNLQRLFPQARMRRFDSDNLRGERLHELYQEILKGDFDILVGTQLLAKGLDLPRLAFVGIIAAESSLALPDYSAEERSFQLLYQVIGRVGRGHGHGSVVIQSYEPDNVVIKSVVERDWAGFYKHMLAERSQFRFPPFSYLLRLECKRATIKGAQTASEKLKKDLISHKLPVEVIGPTPSFYARRGTDFYYQLVLKSKNRSHLVSLAKSVPAGWKIDLDPIDLL